MIKLTHFGTHVEVCEKMDLKSMSAAFIREVISLIPKYITVVLRNQKFSAADFVNIFRRAGVIFESGGYYFNHPGEPEIVIVSNKKNKSGEPIGVFADHEIKWHSNGNTRKQPKGLLALYCKKKGLGGDTYFSNGYLSYEDLKKHYKILCHKVQIITQFPEDLYDFKLENKTFKVFTGQFDRNKNKPEVYFKQLKKPFVKYNPYSKKPAIYFCYPSIKDFEIKNEPSFNKEKLYSYLKQHLFQDKYVYCHKWEEGDLILNDQSSGLHRRDAVKKERLLYRLAFDLK